MLQNKLCYGINNYVEEIIMLLRD